MEQSVIQELRGKKELTRCRKCKKFIWVYWKTGEKKRMTLCAPCYFKGTEGGE